MTTASRHVRIDLPSPDSGQELLLVWSVSRPALAAQWPSLDLSGKPEVAVALTATLKPSGEVGEVRADVEGSQLLIDLTAAASGAWIHDHETGLVHVRICEPTSDTPLLDATIRLAAAAELLYARTTLLGLLKLPGGRYEVSRAALTPMG